MIVRFVLFICFAFASLQASYIILDEGEKSKALYEKLLQKDATLRFIVDKEHLKLQSLTVDKEKLIKIGEFEDERDLALFYMHIVSAFPKAIVMHTPKRVTVEKLVPLPTSSPAASEDDLTIWIALFGLGVIALFALYLSSEEIKVIKKEHQKMQKKQEEIIEIQNKILTSMSENIHSIAEQAVKETKDLVLSTKEDQKLEEVLEKVARSENRLLDVTTDLLEFLRIKSNKITIVNENFHLINLLNDITGQVSATNGHIDFDLLYDIDKSVPNTLLGDTLHLSKIAVNIIDYFKQNGAKSVVVEITREGSFANATLLMRFKSDLIFDIENDENIFVSRYNEEHNQYEGLNLYVAKELSIKMGAELYVKNAEDKTAQFVFTMPFKKVPLSELILTSNTLPKELEGSKILLVDKNASCLQIDTKIFENLNLQVDGIVRREFNHGSFDFSPYDVAVIDEALLTTDLLRRLAVYERLKIVSISSIFVDSKLEHLLDGALKRPLTTSQLRESFIRLFDKDAKQREKEQKKSTITIHKEQFAETPGVTIESFVDFKGASLLIVEDNFINQKVLLSVLKHSQMKIDIANNGQEALELITQGNRKYDLVLMDINMPVMDGYSATQKIREAGFDDLPIVALSALTSNDEINKMFDVGMNGYLAKPFYKERLYTVFAIFIKKKEFSHRPSEPKESGVDPKELHLQGLDVKKGLQNSKNSELFYKEVLEEFKDAFGESAQLFAKLVDEHRYEQVRMLAVDIRGLSGAIGAWRLHDLSIEILQSLLFKKFERLSEFAERFDEEMEILKDDIEVYLKSTS